MNSNLKRWAKHRLRVVGLRSWKEAIEKSDVTTHVVEKFKRCRSLKRFQVSEQRSLAQVFQVPLGKLRDLDRGKIEWIADNYLYDAHKPGMPAPRKENNPDFWKPRVIESVERGTPILGKIFADGKVIMDEVLDEESLPRMPVRFGSGQDIYAMEDVQTGKKLIFQNIPLIEFRDGQAVVYVDDGFASQSRIGSVVIEKDAAYLTTRNGQKHKLDVEHVQRIGKQISVWPDH